VTRLPTAWERLLSLGPFWRRYQSASKPPSVKWWMWSSRLGNDWLTSRTWRTLTNWESQMFASYSPSSGRLQINLIVWSMFAKFRTQSTPTALSLAHRSLSLTGTISMQSSAKAFSSTRSLLQPRICSSPLRLLAMSRTWWFACSSNVYARTGLKTQVNLWILTSCRRRGFQLMRVCSKN